MSRKGFFVLFGPPGAGKSTEAASTFQDSVYFTSSPNILQFYENDFLKTTAGAGLRMPKRIMCIDQFSIDGKVELLGNGMPKPVSQKGTLEAYLQNVIVKALQAKGANQAPPWKNLIIDEAGTFWDRVHHEIEPTVLSRNGAVDTRGAFGVMGKWSRMVTDNLRQLLVCDMNVILVAHSQDPDPSSEKQGGPKFPSANIMKQICADADAVLYRGFEDREAGKPSSRVWLAHGRQNWITKIRGLPDSMYGEIRDWPLGKIISASGFEA